jgi:hypothetical protein
MKKRVVYSLIVLVVVSLLLASCAVTSAGVYDHVLDAEGKEYGFSKKGSRSILISYPEGMTDKELLAAGAEAFRILGESSDGTVLTIYKDSHAVLRFEKPISEEEYEEKNQQAERVYVWS